MIRTLATEEHGAFTLSRLEITYGSPGEPGFELDRLWEFQCSICGEIAGGLREAEARAELTEHEHRTAR